MIDVVRTLAGMGLAVCLLTLPISAARAGSHQDADAGEQKLTALQEAGKQEFNFYCVQCHGASGTGDGVAAAALKKPPADLTRIAERRGGTFDEEEIRDIIDGRVNMPSHGTREMPIWGKHLGEDAADADDTESLVQGRVALLVAYIKTIQRPAAGETK